MHDDTSVIRLVAAWYERIISRIVAHTVKSQEISCGLMFGFHFDMQELQQRDSEGFYFQSGARSSEPASSVTDRDQKGQAGTLNLAVRRRKSVCTQEEWNKRTFSSFLSLIQSREYRLYLLNLWWSFSKNIQIRCFKSKFILLMLTWEVNPLAPCRFWYIFSGLIPL